MTLTMADRDLDIDLEPLCFTLRSLRIHAGELEDFAACLEGEMRKIVGFRRELPMTITVLHDLACDVRERMTEGRGKAVLKQLFPAKSEQVVEEEEKRKEVKVEGGGEDKREWMNAAQLWSGCEEERKEKATEAVSTSSMRSERKSGGMGFGPFDVEWMVRRPPGPIPLPLPYPFAEVSLVAPVVAGSHLIRDCGEGNRSLGTCPSRRLVMSAPVALPSNKMVQQHRHQTSRKARRCWSGELHRKFENALRELGGPDVATPKQIREVMRVEGLTNDEVKSHLQKYRMNSKKMSPAVQVELHLKNSPVHSPDSPLELSRCSVWCGHRPGSCSYESTTDRCNGKVSG